MTKLPDPMAEDELPHTKVTDDILKVIDEGDSNRYQVALRMTAYVEAYTTNKIRDALENLPISYFEGDNDLWLKYISIKDRDEAVRALNHRKETYGR